MKEQNGQLVLIPTLSQPFQGHLSVNTNMNKQEGEQGPYEVNDNESQNSPQFQRDWSHKNSQQNFISLQHTSSTDNKHSPKLDNIVPLEKKDSSQSKNNDQTQLTMECAQVQIQMPIEQGVTNNQIDFSDPKNRQILEDQFFGKSEAIINPSTSSQKIISKFNQRKFKYLAIFLSLAGVALIIIGFIVSFSSSETNLMRGGAFWVLGSICCIPGIYYTHKIIRSHYATKKPDDSTSKDIPRF